MKTIKSYFLSFLGIALILGACSTSESIEDTSGEQPPVIIPTEGENNGNTQSDAYADIDFSNWKVTLPVDLNNNGSPDEFQPSQLVNNGYRNLDELKPFMYDDTTDKSIVFYTYPAFSTINSSYSRTELRELINPSNSKENWTLKESGEMRGRLKVDSISRDEDSSREYHRTIIMQIHGIISQEDMTAFGFSSNNGPPLLKMTWIDGELWAYKKSLRDETTNGDDLLNVSSDTWYDIKHNFGYVGFEPFDFRISATNGKLELQLNDETPFVFQDVSLAKWPFENYFKAGNYLNTTDQEAFSKVKYYNLDITH